MFRYYTFLLQCSWSIPFTLQYRTIRYFLHGLLWFYRCEFCIFFTHSETYRTCVCVCLLLLCKCGIVFVYCWLCIFVISRIIPICRSIDRCLCFEMMSLLCAFPAASKWPKHELVVLVTNVWLCWRVRDCFREPPPFITGRLSFHLNIGVPEKALQTSGRCYTHVFWAHVHLCALLCTALLRCGF